MTKKKTEEEGLNVEEFENPEIAAGPLAKWEPEKFDGTDLLPMNQGTDLAEGEELVGDENVETSDLVLPVLSLLHGTSKPIEDKMEGAAVGLFHMSVTDEIFEPPLRVLFVHHSKSKAMFPKDNDARYADLTRCISRDGLEGDEYGNCEDCGKYKWGADRQPPLCAESHNFVVWTPKGPAILRCRVTNYQTAKEFVTEWRMARVNMWHHPVIISTGTGTKHLASGKIQTFPTLVLSWVRRETVPNEMRKECRAMFDQIQAAWETGRMRGDSDDD
jgi:hypothetical protein